MIKYTLIVTGLALAASLLQVPSWAADKRISSNEVRKSSPEGLYIAQSTYGDDSGSSQNGSGNSGGTYSPPSSCDPNVPSSCTSS